MLQGRILGGVCLFFGLLDSFSWAKIVNQKDECGNQIQVKYEKSILLFALLGGFVSAGSYTRCSTELRLAQESKSPRNQRELGSQCTVLSGQWYQ